MSQTHTTKNQPTQPDHHTATIADMTELSALDLMQLQQQAEERYQKAKRFQQWVNGAIARKFEAQAKTQRTLSGKETGVVHFEVDGVRISTDRVKKLSWDQDQLAEIAQRIARAGDDPTEFLTITYAVAERTYTAWPEQVRRVFAPARTFNTKNPTYKLSLASSRAVRQGGVQ